MDGYIVKANGICKSFPGVRALDHVDFRLKRGEVLALLGENGAGKSTLMKILSGVYQQDEGTIEILGQDVGVMDPQKAQELGVAIIHQEINMCNHLTVAENIFLGREIIKGGVLDDAAMNREAAQYLDELHVDFPPDALVGDLSVSKQQMVEIAKALSTQAKIIFMDEPTSALTSNEIDELFAIIRQLKAAGCGIVYISHRLEELTQIVDRVMILRDGQYVTEMNFADTTLDDIISLMVGREITEQFPRTPSHRGKAILEVEHLSSSTGVKDVSFKVYEGEICGIAGLVGAGRTETTRTIFGADERTGGTIRVDGQVADIRKPADAIAAGVVLVPEDRKRYGLCTKLSIQDNIALPNLDLISSSLNVINTDQESALTHKTVRDLDIRLASVHVDADSLSGGNQQKVVVGKWLARDSRVVIFDEPTRGIDVAAKVEIYNLMNELKDQGVAVLFVSSEMPEILGMSDRILVMAEGKITKEMDVQEATQDAILKYASMYETVAS